MFKPKTAPTLAERIAASVAQREAALSVFRAAADDLRDAEAAADDAAADAQSQIDELVALRDAAFDEKDSAREQRRRIESLIEG